MANQTFPILPDFDKKIREKLSSEPIAKEFPNRKFPRLFADTIRDFIHDEEGLAFFNKGLKQRIIEVNSEKFPVTKTIKRIFEERKTIFPDFLEVCGWWLYGETWTEERKHYFNSDLLALQFQKTEDTQDIKDKTRSSLLSVFETNQQLQMIDKTVRDVIDEQQAKDQYRIADEILHLSNSYLNSINYVDRVFDKGDFIYILLKDLYVHRTVEEEIINRILRQEETNKPFTIVVKGEAGRGKTSLLWHWARFFTPTHKVSKLPSEITEKLAPYRKRLEKEWTNFQADKQKESQFNVPKSLQHYKAIYIKSTDLHSSSIKNIVDKIIQTHQYYQLINQKLLLLVDTLDLLVQLDDGISIIQMAFHRFRTAGISIICTSRIQEAQLIYEQVTKPITISLRDYDKNELRNAIFVHTRKYAYRYQNEEAIEKEYQRILNLVDKGLPVREVCYNPLTFRMLYSIYMPNSIPDNINVHELYRKYWERKVKYDFRPGIDKEEEIDENEIRITPRREKDIDLSRLVHHLALMMLFKGKIDLKYQSVVSILAKKKIPEQHVSELKNRDIVSINKQTNTISFFHQTFFEFASAKTFDELDNGFILFQERIQKNENNLFLLPIYEQLLLLTENSLFHNELVPLEIMRLIQSSGLAENYSAIYVYTLLTETKLDFSQQFIKQLIVRENIIEKYFELIPNTNVKRLPSLFQELGVIYPIVKNIKKFEISFLKAIRRFSPLNHQLVQQFLDTHKIVELIETAQTKSNRLLIYIKIVKPLLYSHFDWTLSHYIMLIVNYPKDMKAHQLIYQILQQHSEELNMKDRLEKYGNISTQLVHHLSYVYSRNKSEHTDFIMRAYSKLWMIEWTNDSPENIIFDSCWKTLNTQHIFEFESKLYALATLTAFQKTEYSILNFIKFYENLSSKHKIIWMRAYLNNALCNENILTTLGGLTLINFIQKNIKSHLSDEDYSGDFKFVIASFRLKNNHLPNKILNAIFNIKELEQEEVWLNQAKKIWMLLPMAYQAGCKGAIKAIITVAKNPLSDKYKRITKKITGYMKSTTAENKLQTTTLSIMQQFPQLDDFVPILELTDKEQLTSNNLLTKTKATLERLINHQKGVKRKEGLRLYKRLLKKQIVDAPTHEKIKTLLKNEDDKVAIEKIIEIIALFGRQIDFDDNKKLIEQYTTLKGTVIDKIFNYYITFLLLNTNYVSGNYNTILDLILTPSHNNNESRNRLKKWNTLIFIFIRNNNINVAFHLATNFFSRLNKDFFSGETSEDVFARNCQQTIFRLMEQINEPQQKMLLKHTIHLPHSIGKEILRAIYHLNFQTSVIQEYIAELKQLKEYSIELEAYINENESILTRVNGVEEWSELKTYILKL